MKQPIVMADDVTIPDDIKSQNCNNTISHDEAIEALESSSIQTKEQNDQVSNDKIVEDRKKKDHNCASTTLYFDINDTQLPIIYSSYYNIAFLGMEKLHPFDAGKWGRIVEFLKEDEILTDEKIVEPKEAQQTDLLVVHPKKYLDSLRWSSNVARITEVPPVALVPNFIVQRKVLRPFRYQTGGSILAGKLALERGWAINVGGGFHHCSADRGGGFCAYADITLCIMFMFNNIPSVKKAMIVDLDAHQGNGYARDFMDNKNVYILDIYNRNIYPHDGFAKRAIKRKVELTCFTKDEQYLATVKRHVNGALNEFKPDVIIYNAGTDILADDPLGRLSISPEGIKQRDQITFECARSRNIPIVMLTSGGYQRTNARIIADSIINLNSLNLISSTKFIQSKGNHEENSHDDEFEESVEDHQEMDAKHQCESQ